MNWEDIALSAVSVPVSLACLGYAVWRLFGVAWLRRSGTRTPGTIVSLKPVKKLDEKRRERTWKTLVAFRFQGADGRTVEADYLAAKPEFSTGHDVTVAYDPANPESAVVMESTLHLRTYIFWVAASVLFVLASVWWVLTETGVVETLV